MAMFRPVTDTLSVSPQITIADVAAAAARGVTLIINNRPDGEDAGQTPAADIEAAARAEGLDFVSVPIVGRPTPEQVAAIRATIQGARGNVLAYCRSGTRSITAWAMGEALAGADRADIVSRGAAAGYDLSWLGPT